MIIIGIKLTAGGMGIVFLFLVILYLILLLSGRLLSPVSAAELASIEAEERVKQKKRRSNAEQGALIPVITAAVTAYRNRKKS